MKRYQLKIKRVEKAYMQLLSEAIHVHLGDPRLKSKSIVITRVCMNRDCSKASIFFILEVEKEQQQQKNKIIKALYTSAPYLLSFIAQRLQMRFLPELSFFYDSHTEKANKVVHLIDQQSRLLSKEASPFVPEEKKINEIKNDPAADETNCF